MVSRRVHNLAQAILDTAAQHGLVRDIVADMRALERALRSYPALRQVLSHAGVTDKKKEELLADIQKFNPLIVAFAIQQGKRRQLHQFSSVVRTLQRLAVGQKLLLLAELRTSEPVTVKVREAVEKLLQSMGAQEVLLQSEIDPTLGGGMVIKTPEFVIDRSLRGSLTRLRAQLINE